jgi:pimeloyl-ACP methyl ester carboxylesterase
MPKTATIDYSLLDSADVLNFLFHPRPTYGPSSIPSARDILIPVAEDVVIGGRFHVTGQSAVNILFFHGNGEIVDDYDDLGPLYNRFGINFLAADYRGYGSSTGTPTVSTMMADCHLIFRYVREWLRDHGCGGALVVMGRSLGSASALELASHYPEQIAGLIIESGFAYTGPLLRLIGVDTEALGFEESQGIRNLEKIRSFRKPTLIIHAEFDHIIPFSDGQALYAASPAADKRLVKVPQANHNNILALGLQQYLEAVKSLAERLQ